MSSVRLLIVTEARVDGVHCDTSCLHFTKGEAEWGPLPWVCALFDETLQTSRDDILNRRRPFRHMRCDECVEAEQRSRAVKGRL